MVQLKWGTYAMKLFSQKRGIEGTLASIFKDLANMSQDLDVAVCVFQAASEAATKYVPEYEEVCEWIDDCGGLLAKTGPIFEFGSYLMSTMGVDVETPEEEEKKSEQNA